MPPDGSFGEPPLGTEFPVFPPAFSLEPPVPVPFPVSWPELESGLIFHENLRRKFKPETSAEETDKDTSCSDTVSGQSEISPQIEAGEEIARSKNNPENQVLPKIQSGEKQGRF